MRSTRLVVSSSFALLVWAERRPALAQAVTAPLICWSFSSSMFRCRLVDHAVPAMCRSLAAMLDRPIFSVRAKVFCLETGFLVEGAVASGRREAYRCCTEGCTVALVAAPFAKYFLSTVRRGPTRSRQGGDIWE